MIKDERGQWIISAGFLVSASLVILTLLLNQAMMGGYQSSAAILEFPKHEIREFVQETHREVNIAADRAWEKAPYNNTSPPYNTTKDWDDVRFNFSIANFTDQTLHIYATHGQFVNISLNKTAGISFYGNGTIKDVNVTILFSDGATTCTFNPEIIEIET